MNKKFKLLNHTADIKIEIYGNDINDLFNSGYLAWRYIVSEINEIKTEDKDIKISITENNLEYLLAEYIKELNYYLTVKKIMLINPKIAVTQDDKKYTINCEFMGLSINENDIIIKEEIKAVTLHKLSITNSNNKLIATIILDV